MAQHPSMSTVNTCQSIIGQSMTSDNCQINDTYGSGAKFSNVANTINSVVNNASSNSVNNATNSFATSNFATSNFATSNATGPKSLNTSDQSLDGAKQLLTKSRLLELVGEVDASIQLDEDVEDMLVNMADSFVNSIVEGSCKIAKHRHNSSLEVKDVQLYLEQAYNMWIPGLGTDELKAYKRPAMTDAHKQRMALMKKKK